MNRVLPDLHKTRPLLGEEAYAYLRSLLYEPYPSFEEALKKIIAFLCHTGLQDEGIEAYEELFKIYSNSGKAPEEVVLSSYLQTLMYGSPEIQTNEKIYKAHVNCSRHFASEKVYTTYSNPPLAGRRLKIGYACHFITNTPSRNWLQPMLKAHNRDRLEVFYYSDEPINEKTESVRGLAEHWRDTYGMDTDAFCELVRKDGIDILVEMNGHGVSQRYYAIARHPAPVQVATYNYACTTGVPGMDYVLCSDDVPLDLEGLQPYYSEKILRKRGTSWAVPPGEHFSPVATECAFEKNGYITFGGFGQAHKLPRQQIALWCEVLKRVPNSRFFMKAGLLGVPETRAAFLHHFTSNGIDPSRLIMEGNSEYHILLQCYERVDIALDTYPYNAGTTTYEAIMQGVPVISQIGSRYSALAGQAIVGTGGHPELQARTAEEYVSKAVALANDPERIRQYRRTLRSDYLRSPRVDVKRFIAELEDAFTEAWREYETRHISMKKQQHG